MYNEFVQRVGWIDDNGHVYGPQAEPICLVAHDGRALAAGSQLIGTIDHESHALAGLSLRNRAITWGTAATSAPKRS